MCADYLDTFGAPEIYVDGVAWREMVGADLIRSAFYSNEHGNKIIRVKILIPLMVCSLEHLMLQEFIARKARPARLLAH